MLLIVFWFWWFKFFSSGINITSSLCISGFLLLNTFSFLFLQASLCLNSISQSFDLFDLSAALNLLCYLPSCFGASVFWKEKKLYGLFLCMGFNCLKVTEPLWRDTLLFTIHLPGVSGTQLIYLERIKSCVDLGATQWFWMWDPWIENPGP